jgi:hypothetical protein
VLSCRMEEMLLGQMISSGWLLLLCASVACTSVQLDWFDHCMMSIDCRGDVTV